MPIKTFRGKIVHGGQDTIVLHTNDGSIGYQIKKFQLMAKDPSESLENTVKVTSTRQTTIDGDVNFSDPNILAVGMIWASTSQANVHESNIVFENMIFNQDIYITNYDIQTAGEINYYIELEQMKLDLNENTAATLKDIRNVFSQVHTP